MSLALDMIDAAMAADLTPNEHKVFLILFRQTVCYGRKTDNLCIPQFVRLTGIRKDRLIPAIASVLGKGLFEVSPSREFQHRYRIPAKFLAPYQSGFYPPNVPQNRIDSRSTEAISEKQNTTGFTHTTPANPTANSANQTNTTPNQADSAQTNSAPPRPDLPYPPQLSPHHRRTASRLLHRLKFEDARDCLLVLHHAMQTQHVRSPLGYLQHLIHSVQEGTFDRSVLPPLPLDQNTPLAPSSVHHVQAMLAAKQQRLRYLQAEIRGLDALYKKAGMPMDEASAARRADYVAEYQQLMAA